MKADILIPVDTQALSKYTDAHLAALWHVAQANPAPIENPAAGQVAEAIGREIIRRFLATTPPLLWEHQGRHADWAKLHLPQDGAGDSTEGGDA